MKEGFGFYLGHFDDNIASLKELNSFFMKWASVEAQYAKSMCDLSRNVNKKAWKKMEKEVGTFQECFTVFNTEIEKIGRKHDEVSSKLAREICPQIDALVKESEKTVKKKLATRCTDLHKELSEQYKKLKKTKDDYHKANKDADSAREQFETKSKESAVNQKVIAKLKATAKKKQSQAESAHMAYKKQLESANASQTKFFSKDMPALLDQFQNYDEERASFLKRIFGEAMGTLNTLPEFYTPLLEAMQEAVDNIDEASDIVAFIQLHASQSVDVPGEIPYEAYVSDLPAPSSDLSSGMTAPMPATPGGGAAAGGGPGGPPSGAASASVGEIGTYRERPSIDPVKEFPGLTKADKDLSDEQKAEKLQSQISAIQAEVMLQEKSKKGLESLFPLYQNDKVQLDSLKQGFSDVEKQIATLVERKAALEKDLKAIATAGAASAAASPAADADDDDDVEEAEVSFARALYDYTATQDTELSFKQGAVLVVVDQDPSGWWYCELADSSDTAGFAPHNFLSEITPEEAEELQRAQ